MYFRFGRSNHLSGIHSNSLSMRILKKKQTITGQYGLETTSYYPRPWSHFSTLSTIGFFFDWHWNKRGGMIILQPFSHTSICNQRKGMEPLQTDVNDILYAILLSKLGYWYIFTVVPSNVSLWEWIVLIWEANCLPHERAFALWQVCSSMGLSHGSKVCSEHINDL